MELKRWVGSDGGGREFFAFTKMLSWRISKKNQISRFANAEFIIFCRVNAVEFNFSPFFSSEQNLISEVVREFSCFVLS